MKKVIIWGTGGMAHGLSKSFDVTEVEIVAYVDNDHLKWSRLYNGYEIISPQQLRDKEFDYIFISSELYQRDIFSQIIELGIDNEKVIMASITKAELGRVFELFTEKGLNYLIHIASANKIEMLQKRNVNLFLKEYFERQAADFIVKKFITDRNAPGKNVIFEDRNTYYDYVLSNIKNKDGLYLEFGVYKGDSINYISKRIGNNTVYGFDSFEGLPEGWLPGYQKGKFNEAGRLPVVNENVKLIKGWFEQTLPNFVREHRDQKCSFINIDCDLYSATKCIFDHLKEFIGKGTMICFDEFVGHIGWQDDEYKAFLEFIEETGYEYRYVACAFGGGHQLTERVAIEIL